MEPSTQDTQTLPGWLQSSEDPNKISLSIQSGAKALVSILGLYAAFTHYDPTQAQNVIQLINDYLIIAVPAIFTAYHALEGVWGVLRKFLIRGTK